jgi:hypothetical protein
MATFTADTFANRPAAGTAGDLFVPTDGFCMYRDDGANWQAWGPMFPFTAPPASGWSWVNQGTASVDEARTVFVLSAPAVATYQIRCRVRTMAAAPWTLTAYIMNWSEMRQGRMAGIVLRDSGTGRLITFGVFPENNAEYNMNVTRWTDATTISSIPKSTLLNQGEQVMFLRVTDDNTNLTYYWSHDGQNWVQFQQEGRTAWLASADQYGWHLQPAATLDSHGMLLSWVES